MKFVLQMAVRETRASWRRLLFFFVCIAIGVAAIVALRSVIQNVRGVFGREARSLIAADVLISTNREWTEAARATIDRRLVEAGADARTDTVETPTMVRPADSSKPTARMVELRAVGAEFPLYGAVGLQSGEPYSYAMLQNRGVLVRAELLTALSVKVGDEVTISRLHDQGSSPTSRRRVGDFSMGPGILIAIGSSGDRAPAVRRRVRRVLQVRIPEEPHPAAVETLRDDFRSVRQRLRSGGRRKIGRD